MKVNKIICFAVGAMLAATGECADEISIVSNICVVFEGEDGRCSEPRPL